MKQIVGLVAVVVTLALGGCMATGTGTYDAYGQAGYATPATYGTGVFVNNTELTPSDKAQLDSILGEGVPAGRYWMDANYNFGYEGQAASVNLRELYIAQHPQAQQQRGTSMYSTDTAGRGSSIVSEGGCTILSTPDGSLSSGC